MSDGSEKLDYSIQKWIFKQGWSSLRKIQYDAIDPILAGSSDVIISASTAAGKTEAFFLPAISSLLSDSEFQGVGILYISPLKALINDQDRRLESLSELTGIPVTPWHGDSLISKKNKLKKKPSGIVLITPESLESILVRDPGWAKSALGSLKYIVIDEFHAFIGSERGHHLISLLHRLEHLSDRLQNPIPRVALSATLGNIENVPLSLRPHQSLPCEIIQNSNAQSTIKVQAKGYLNPNDTNNGLVPTAEELICSDLMKFCRGGNHLVFANSRGRTESIAATLSELCEKEVVPNEFFPHHGSLSKELRETLERRLQKEHHPTTAVCTMTLELGIDIGKVNSVIQVTAPHSISSLRQRMGRSGRRGDPAVLRMLISENELSKNSHPVDCLRLELVQSLAMVRLLLSDKWYEPADTKLYHFSTLLHQVLAVIAQWGGIRASQLFELLCKLGPFQNIGANDFKILLQHLGKEELITQLGNGELTLGVKGERVASHYSFYAVFKTPEEYRIVSGTKTLGTLPIDSLVIKGQQIVFGGQKWLVKDVDAERKVISVSKSRGGKPPKFGGAGVIIHDKIRQEMFNILKDGDFRISVGDNKFNFADRMANSLFEESLDFFNRAGLSSTPLLEYGGSVYLFSWKGDKVVNTLEVLLIIKGFTVSSGAGVIEIENASTNDVLNAFKGILESELPEEKDLAKYIEDKFTEKFDEFLPYELLCKGFGRKFFDIKKTKLYLLRILESTLNN